MFKIVNEEIFKILIWKKIIPNRIYYIIENGVLVAVDPPAGGFAKISDFFPGDLSKWNLGENFGFVKFKIFEWKLVFPLIFADDFFKIFHSGIFWNCVGGISFSDKLGGIAGDFIFIFIFRIRHFFSGDKFFENDKGKNFLWEKEGNEILKFATFDF